MFGSLSDRLSETFKGLRGKGRLSEADIDATVKEIRTALLEADVALPVVRAFAARVKERALSSEVSGALPPGQQVVKIVHEELIDILGGQTRPLRFAKTGPTFVLLTGLLGIVRRVGLLTFVPAGKRPCASAKDSTAHKDN